MLESIRKMLALVLISTISYGLFVNIILPSSRAFINYTNEEFIVDFYNKLSPSVVQVSNDSDGNSSTGSGVYIAENLVVTNHHVIQGTQPGGIVTVISNQGVFMGVLIKDYPMSDLALILTYDNPGIPVKMTDSNTLKVGDRAISIGASFGFYSTLGVGYVTGLDRFVGLPPFSGIISVSTGIMPGNSGGPVFNVKGELIGISYAGMRSSDNMGFVIPVNLVREKFKEFLK